MHDLKRIEFLKSRLAEERPLAVELGERFNQPPFKHKARRLVEDIDEVRDTFLSKNLEEWRPERAETIVLDLVERHIQIFITGPREHLQNILAQYGPDVTLIG
jgi:hypothetical protein